MSDEADLAAELAAVEIAAALTLVEAAIPAGAPGECDDCGEVMPRLVGGRCGFCRDGRRPPLSFFDRQPAPGAAPEPASPPPASPKPKEADMPTPQYAAKTITTPIESAAVVKQIEKFAAELDLPVGRAAAKLIIAGLDYINAPSIEATMPAEQVDAGELSTAELLAELNRRVNGVSALVDAAMARAESAEGQLATLKLQVRQLVGEG